MTHHPAPLSPETARHWADLLRLDRLARADLEGNTRTAASARRVQIARARGESLECEA